MRTNYFVIVHAGRASQRDVLLLLEPTRRTCHKILGNCLGAGLPAFRHDDAARARGQSRRAGDGGERPPLLSYLRLQSRKLVKHALELLTRW